MSLMAKKLSKHTHHNNANLSKNECSAYVSAKLINVLTKEK